MVVTYFMLLLGDNSHLVLCVRLEQWDLEKPSKQGKDYRGVWLHPVLVRTPFLEVVETKRRIY